jgi:hypothetical protein
MKIRRKAMNGCKLRSFKPAEEKSLANMQGKRRHAAERRNDGSRAFSRG